MRPLATPGQFLVDLLRDWQARYAAEHYVHGTGPDTFPLDAVTTLSAGDTSCLADGEGRNSVFRRERGAHCVFRPS